MTSSLGAVRANQQRVGDAPSASRRYAVAGIVFGLAFPVLATIIRLAQSSGGFAWATILEVQRTDPLLWIIDTAPVFLGLLALFAGRRQDAATGRNQQLLAREQELTRIQSSLESRVLERTQDAEDRSRELREAVLLTRTLSGLTDASALLATAAKSLAEMYRGHRVDIYLIDEPARTGALVASSSTDRTTSPGSFRVGDDSIQGRAAAGDQSVQVGTSESASREIALPLIVRGKTIGVIAITAEAVAGRRREPRMDLLQLVVDQIAASVDSAQHLEETESALLQLRTLTGERSRRGWRDFVAQHRVCYEYAPGSVRQVAQATPGSGSEWMQVPLTLRDQRVGSIAVRRDPSLPWTEGERELARKVSTQVASALDTVRLLLEAQERAERERQMAQLSARLGATVDMETLLQTAAQEIASLPGVARATVVLKTPAQTREGGRAASAPDDGRG